MIETQMVVLIVTDIGNKDTPHMEDHFLPKFTIELQVRRKIKQRL